jgi:SAM-dependent methyltransferase
VSVVWHDLECGNYTEDLPLWRDLARTRGGPVLDVGAGTGRTALDLARAGYAVTALDLDAELLEGLRARAGALAVDTVVGDARAFSLPQRFGLCIVPMQTIQLLGGAEGRMSFLRCAREHLREDGLIAIAIADELDLFEVTEGAPAPLPDVVEADGIVYCSRPTAVRTDGDGFALERRRETVAADGTLEAELDLIHLDRLDADTLDGEAVAVGLRPAGRSVIAPTSDYVGSLVVMLGG